MTAASTSKTRKTKAKSRTKRVKGEGNISPTRLRNAMIRACGSPTRAAQELGCTVGNVTQRLARSPAIQAEIDAALADLDGDTLAMARGNVREAVEKRDMTTSRWLLGVRDPAYAGKTQVAHALDDESLDAVVGAFGGDLVALRKLRTST